jgi:hypothetical protein
MDRTTELMRNFWAALLLFCTVVAGAADTAESSGAGRQSLRIGIGFRDASRFCVALQDSHLSPGSRVVVVSPLDRTWGETEVLEVARQPCPGTEDPSGRTSYELRLAKGEFQKTIALVGVVSGLEAFAVSDNTVTAADGNGKTASFRACLADGGVYLTLWSGKPLEGELLWHGFRFVDFDMDAENCTPKDQPK